MDHWDVFRLARVLLLLALREAGKTGLPRDDRGPAQHADLREQAAIYSAYALLPHQEELVESAIDGLRSNIVDVYDSIALNNPFPRPLHRRARGTRWC